MNRIARAGRVSRGFTLVEMLVVITIVAILLVGTFAPYNYYNQSARVRLSAQRLEQTFSEARTLAANGVVFPGTTNNANVGMLLRRGSGTVVLFAYPHDIATGSISTTVGPDVRILRSVALENAVGIADTGAGNNDVLAYFRAPYATVTFFDMGGGVPNARTGTGIDVALGINSVATGSLSRVVSLTR